MYFHHIRELHPLIPIHLIQASLHLISPDPVCVSCKLQVPVLDLSLPRSIHHPLTILLSYFLPPIMPCQMLSIPIIQRHPEYRKLTGCVYSGCHLNYFLLCVCSHKLFFQLSFTDKVHYSLVVVSKDHNNQKEDSRCCILQRS